MEQSLYQPLLGPEFCRVLTLLPGRREDPLICGLEVVKLDPNLRYEALSYVWEEKIPLCLEQKDNVEYRRKKFENFVICNNHQIRVKENLFAALLQLRAMSGQEPRKLWIDALCIDQCNKAELGAQVAIMRHIYRSAERVLIWIGDEDDDVTPSWNLLQRYARDFQQIVPSTTARLCGIAGRLGSLPYKLVYNADVATTSHFFEYLIRRAQPVQNLLSALEVSEENLENVDRGILGRPWFQRVWTLQEIVVSRSALLLYGPFSMPWTDFQQFFNSYNVGRSSNNMNIAHLYHVNTITKAFRNSELHLSPLLIFTWYRKATDPKDRIFALLGLLPEGLYPTLKPDYHLQPSEVFIAVTRVCIEVDKSLAFLRTAGLKYRRDVLSPHMASWVPDFVNHEDPEKSSDEVFDLVDTRIATRYMTPVMGPRSVGLRLQLRGFVVGIMSKCVHPASPNVPWGLSFCMKPVHAGNWSDGFELSACRAHRSWNDRSDRKNELCRAFGINKGWYKEGDWYCVMLGGDDFYILRPSEGNQPTMKNAASDGPICSLVCSGAEEGMGNLSLEDGLVQSAFASHEARNDWVDFILV